MPQRSPFALPSSMFSLESEILSPLSAQLEAKVTDSEMAAICIQCYRNARVKAEIPLSRAPSNVNPFHLVFFFWRVEGTKKMGRII